MKSTKTVKIKNLNITINVTGNTSNSNVELRDVVVKALQEVVTPPATK